MAPSPELGQPKAPDKTSSGNGSVSAAPAAAGSTKKNTTNCSSSGASDTVSNHMASNADPTTNCGNMITSISTNSNSAGNSLSASSNATVPAAAVVSSTTANSGQEKSRDLESMKYADFTKLLNEAYSYKTPKDRENKSETFKQLLVEVERSDNTFSTLTQNPRGSNNHSGSLQNLGESPLEYLDSDYTYGSKNRRYHCNSRTMPKYTSLVSTRQREGGSLPSNVNVSNCHLNEPRFLNEVAAASGARRRGRNERTCSGTSYESKDDSSLGDNAIVGTEVSEDRYQGKSNPIDIVDAHTTMKATLEIACPESKHNNLVDDTVRFASLERGKTTVDTTCVLPFDDSSKSCQSILGEKLEKPKTTIYQASKIVSQQLDDNCNTIGSKKKKKFDADRNTTTINAEEAEGYRGRESIDTLVKFIESTESKRSDGSEPAKRSDKNCTVPGKKKDRKKEKDLRKEMHKVKKSTSMEELRSCTKLDEDEKIESGVVLRTKGKKGNSTSMSTSSNDGKDAIGIKSNSKRGERRSWGTEELTYLGENQSVNDSTNRDKTKEKEKSKKARENIEKLDKFEKMEKNMQKKKKSERSASVHSVESMQSEAAEFHVVTKKKKSKKRQSLEETRIVGKNNPFAGKSSVPGHKKYQSSNSFSTDRDAYLTTYNAHDSRRKSTSSVPPSEKSDSSDLDSVHSLPIGSVSGNSSSNLHQSASSAQTQLQSYADIARTVNAQRQYAASITMQGGTSKTEKWPAVSAGLSLSSSSSSTNTTNSTVAAISDALEGFVAGTPNNKIRSLNVKSKSLAKDFPDLTDRNRTFTVAYNNNDAASSCSSSSSTSTVAKQMTYSQSLGDEKIIAVDLPKSNSKSPPAYATTTMVTTKISDILKANDVGNLSSSSSSSSSKQILQKSRSADNERYYSVDQYPALEKTIKRHSTQNPLGGDIKPIQNVTPTLISNEFSQLSNSKQRSPALLSYPNQIPSSIISSGGGITVYSTTASNSCLTTASSIVATAPSDTSKIVINNLDMNTKIAATSSSNVSNAISSSCSSISNVKKPKVGTKVDGGGEPSSNSILANAADVKNQKSQQQQQQLQTTTTTNYIVDTLQSSGGSDIQAANMHSINMKKNLKSEIQQIFVGNPISIRKPRKEKQSNSDDLNNTIGLTGHAQQSQSSINPLGKNSNRPAVIILNDCNDSALCSGGDFTFGDFNEEELRLFESNQPLDDSASSSSHNVSGPDVNSSTSLTSELLVQEDIHMSPHSDLGYSSSNNRSLFSESMDNNTNETGTASNRTIIASDIEMRATTTITTTSSSSSSSSTSSTPNVSAHDITKATIKSSNSYFPNDSAIIIATKIGSPPTSQLNQPLKQQQQHTYGQPSKTTNITNVLRDSVANVISNKIRDKTSNELTMKFDTNTTCNSNDLLNNSSSGFDNLNNNVININHSSVDRNKEMSSLVTISTPATVTAPAATADTKRSMYPSSQDGFAGIETGSMDDNNNSSVNYIKIRSTAAATTGDVNIIHNTVGNIQKSNCDNNMRKFNRREINIRFVAPPVPLDINSTNYEKIVDFVGLAWQDILRGVNGETEFYDGQ